MIAATKACGCPQSQPSLLARAKGPYSLSEERFHCCKKFRCAPSCSGHVSSTVTSAASRSSAERIPTGEKIVSEIVRKKQPYKEIEAVINDNRVIIRTHKERDKKRYEPPCECVGQEVLADDSTSSLRRCENGVALEMASGNLEICRAPREDAKTGCDRGGCRAITLYPNVKDDAAAEKCSHAEREESREQLDQEENPNIFVLRIRKRSDIGDKKQKIDLEFRAPRPWRSTKKRRFSASENAEKI